MRLEHQLVSLNNKYHLWDKKSRLLLAVSGGLDSMVMLVLFLSLPEKLRPQLAVVHVNHCLREVSDQEQLFLKSYCKDVNIPFFSTCWQAGLKIKTAIEANARAFRYQYFEQILHENGYDSLLTAHHADDQAETILMKLLRGSQFSQLSGINLCRPFGKENTKRLIRPLLHFSKAELNQYAQVKAVPYMEDESNFSDDYLRNRLRHQVMPVLKAENPGFLEHIRSFSQQVKYTEELVSQMIVPLYDQLIQQTAEMEWIIDINQFQLLSESEQYMLLQYWFRKTLIAAGVELKQRHVREAQQLLSKQTGEKILQLASQWRLRCSYAHGILYNQGYLVNAYSDQPEENKSFTLHVNEYIRLSNNEWVGLYVLDNEVPLPDLADNCDRYDLQISAEQSSFPLHVRHRQAGDRIRFKDYSKKVNRLFIDEKISKMEREHIWLITDAIGEIIWIVPKYQSYLSILKETDKIQYRLIYWKNEDCLEGDADAGKRH